MEQEIKKSKRKFKIKWWYLVLAYLLFAGLLMLVEQIVVSRLF